ncbi:hypothetical protein BBP40_001272 [Aspergillus hancockii]|nr:hypothetical protein BBP40_001272 [Aspergillus hancockii]
MASSAAERRQIFLACKAIFSGTNALLRKLKAVQKLVAAHQASLRTLIPNFNVNRVAIIVQGLLKKGVFQSDVKAKLEFPDLFEPSPARESQHDAFEHEAARSAVEVLEEIASVHERQDRETKPVPPPVLPVAVETTVEADMLIMGKLSPSYPAPPPPPSAEPEQRIPSLYPSYFPYHAQHSILSTVQNTLEECCFDFANKWLPSEISSRGWECPAAVELTQWTRLLPMWASQLPDGALKLGGSELSELLATIPKIRHTAVHRLPTTARGIGTLVNCAMRLAEALQDPLRMSQLEDLYLDVQSKTEEMELNKNALEEDLVCELISIQLQREELERREEELRAKAVSKDQENKVLMGLLVEESMESIFNGGKAELDDSSTESATGDEGSEDERSKIEIPSTLRKWVQRLISIM